MAIAQKFYLCAIFVFYSILHQMSVAAQTEPPLRDLTVGNRFMYKTSIANYLLLSGTVLRDRNITFYGYEDIIRDTIINKQRYSLVFTSFNKSYHWERSDANAVYLWNNGEETLSHRRDLKAGQALQILPINGIGCDPFTDLFVSQCTIATISITSSATLSSEGNVLSLTDNVGYESRQGREVTTISTTFSLDYESSFFVKRMQRRYSFSKIAQGPPFNISLQVNSASEATELIGSQISSFTNGTLSVPFRVRLNPKPIFIALDTLELAILCTNKGVSESFGTQSPIIEIAYNPSIIRQVLSNSLYRWQDSSGIAIATLPTTIASGEQVVDRIRFYIIPNQLDSIKFRLQNFKQTLYYVNTPDGLNSSIYPQARHWFVPEAIEGSGEAKVGQPKLKSVPSSASILLPNLLNVTSRKRTTIPIRLTGDLREAFENGITTVQTALLIDSAICDYSLVARASDGRGRIPITFRLSDSSDTAYTEVSTTFLANAQRAMNSGFTDTLSVTTGTITAEPVLLTRGLVTFAVQPERPATVQVIVPTLRPTIVLPRLEATAGERLTIGMTMTGLDTLNQYYLPSTIEFGLRFNASLLEPLDGLASELSLQNSTRTIYRYLFSGNSYTYQPNSELSFVVRGAFGNDTATSLGATIRTQDGGIRIVPTVQQGSVRMRGNTAGGAFRFYSPKNRLLMTINPNPTQDVATLSYTVAEQGMIEIAVFNTLGTKVFSRNVVNEAKTSEERLDLSSLPPGVYSVRILSGTSSDALRLVKL